MWLQLLVTVTSLPNDMEEILHLSGVLEIQSSGLAWRLGVLAHHIPSLEKQILVIEISGKGSKLGLTPFQIYAVNAVFLYMVHRFESLLQGSRY